jgi:hypothetical protein
MLRIVGLVAVATLTSACFPTAELSQDGVYGSYVVNGLDPIGTEYTGRVTISRGADINDVIMEWVITGAIIHGEGVIAGDTMEIRWETVNDPGGTISSGTASYEILDDGRLTGTITVDGFDQLGSETIYPDP